MIGLFYYLKFHHSGIYTAAARAGHVGLINYLIVDS